MIKGSRKVLVVIVGILCVTILAVLKVPDVGEAAFAISGMVCTFLGAHGFSDYAAAKNGKPALTLTTSGPVAP